MTQPTPNPYPSTLPHPPSAAHAQYPPAPPASAPVSLWRQVPTVYWVGLGLGALAFVVRISVQSVRAGFSGYSCSYIDLAGIVVAVALVGITCAGWVSRGSGHVSMRLPVPLMSALSVLLLALAFVHALRGTGTIMSPCDARPLP